MNRKTFLENEIRKHNKLYWKENAPIISDPNYDNLVRQLEKIDPNNELLREIHTPQVTSEGKVRHQKPMLSLEKVYSIEGILKWCTKVARSEEEEFKIQPKYDGCSAELTSGILSTRGDGLFGEDITSQLPIIKIEKDGQTISGLLCNENVKGEILFKKSEFTKNRSKITKKNGEEYKNERNATGGLINRDDIDFSIGTILTLVDFEETSFVIKLKNIPNFDWDPLIKFTQTDDYPADGLVLKIKDEEYAESLGATSSHLKSQIALKFENPTGETVLEEVMWSAGKHTLTPIGKVTPVEISGITIQHANLHNYKYILDNDIHIGDTLIIERAGDVIPDVQKVIPGNVRIKITINKCPICNSQVEYIEPKIICVNKDCPGKHINKLMDSVTRIGIERLGLPTLEKMVSDLGVYDLVDIFKLKKEDIMTLEGFAESSSENLFLEIQKVKTKSVLEWQILSSLNIPGVGNTLSQILLKNKTLNDIRNMSESQFLDFDGVGPERAKVLINGLSLNSHYIDFLLHILPVRLSPLPIAVTTFCMTGKFPEKKAYYKELLEPHGFKDMDSVKEDLDYLICDDLKGSGKQKKAEKLGIPIITSSELLEKITSSNL